MYEVFAVPSEVDLVEFFGVEPKEVDIGDGYWCYEASSGSVHSLRFSLNLYERSVQVELRYVDAVLITVSCEMATRLYVVGDELRCEFLGEGMRSILIVDKKSSFGVSWATLQVE